MCDFGIRTTPPVSTGSPLFKTMTQSNPLSITYTKAVVYIHSFFNVQYRYSYIQ